MMRPSSLVPFLERQEIERKAAELKLVSTGENHPSDASDIARRIGIPVKTVTFDRPDIAGMLVREGDRAEIRVNADDPYERQNFTIAHELGHLILQHPGTWKDTKNTMYRRSAWSAGVDGRRAEYQANLFAAALLMPETAVRERWDLSRSPNYWAPYFRVSKQAILLRLEELGLIVLSPKEVRFLNLSDWVAKAEVPELPTVSDDLGPVPRFPPIATDELGRIIPMSDEEWAARSSAITRVLRIAGDRTDEGSQVDNGELGE